jgi:gamma-glutamyl:cysteine ligase YbdK (ATP-grasp superfamily)
MGLAIDRDEWSDAEREAFARRLRDGLEALALVLARPGFGEGPASIGAEVELSLVDAASRPLARNLEVLAGTRDPRLTVELDRFNLECNSRPFPLAGRPFAALGADLAEALGEVARAARAQGGAVVLAGILPTLRERDLQRDAMTDLPRFRALSASIRRLRGAAFDLRIDGDEPLATSCADVTFEGAATSLQIHLRVAPRDFARLHAAAQIATAPVLAAAGNSPLFLGHRLWEETRVALFKQAVDERRPLPDSWHPAARVSFGTGWARAGAHELFAESVALHAPLLAACGGEEPLACARAGGVPRLDELRLHHGTVWRWNRAVYDPAEGGHLRIELRALPSGPTLADMLANAAFALGLTLALAPEIDWMVPAFPFAHAERNFYRAAQHGLGAELLWPAREAPSPRPHGAAALVSALLPLARRGLAAAGVDEDEAARHLAVIEARVATGQTGARWQRAMLERFERGAARDEALAALVARYAAESASGRPVHEWSLAP